MKLIIVVTDGMADWRYPELANHSPAEYANTPGIDHIIRNGQVGLAQTMYEGLPLGSLVGLLGILGYRPPDYFPLGRSIFEAQILGIPITPSDLVCRCNVVWVENDTLTDFTSHQIDDATATAYLQSITLPAGIEIHHDLSYRNVLVYRNSDVDETALTLAEPHENVGNRLHNLLPRYHNSTYQPFASMMLHSRRGNLMLWPWGAGRIKKFPPAPHRMLTITALSFLAGMALSLGGKAIIPNGTTGYRGSNLTAKLDTAIQHFPDIDVCLIHCNAPDEESHIKNVAGKVAAIEEIDQKVITPLLRHLDQLNEPARVWLLPDHYTICQNGRHGADPVPYVIYGTGITPNHSLTTYSETGIAAVAQGKPLRESHEFIASLL